MKIEATNNRGSKPAIITPEKSQESNTATVGVQIPKQAEKVKNQKVKNNSKVFYFTLGAGGIIMAAALAHFYFDFFNTLDIAHRFEFISKYFPNWLSKNSNPV